MLIGYKERLERIKFKIDRTTPIERCTDSDAERKLVVVKPERYRGSP
jgi:hypothetical protein